MLQHWVNHHISLKPKAKPNMFEEPGSWRPFKTSEGHSVYSDLGINESLPSIVSIRCMASPIHVRGPVVPWPHGLVSP